jgi:carbon storage regulator
MLVLSRRVGEAVCVGPGVTVRVVETKGGRVRLAIDAPSDIRILRAELEALPAACSDRLQAVRAGVDVLSAGG